MSSVQLHIVQCILLYRATQEAALMPAKLMPAKLQSLPAARCKAWSHFALLVHVGLSACRLAV
jgi:hypothetical protein